MNTQKGIDRTVGTLASLMIVRSNRDTPSLSLRFSVAKGTSAKGSGGKGDGAEEEEEEGDEEEAKPAFNVDRLRAETKTPFRTVRLPSFLLLLMVQSEDILCVLRCCYRATSAVPGIIVVY